MMQSHLDTASLRDEAPSHESSILRHIDLTTDHVPAGRASNSLAPGGGRRRATLGDGGNHVLFSYFISFQSGTTRNDARRSHVIDNYLFFLIAA